MLNWEIFLQEVAVGGVCVTFIYLQKSSFCTYVRTYVHLMWGLGCGRCQSEGFIAGRLSVDKPTEPSWCQGFLTRLLIALGASIYVIPVLGMNGLT